VFAFGEGAGCPLRTRQTRPRSAVGQGLRGPAFATGD
jgi:hypothetical protein